MVKNLYWSAVCKKEAVKARLMEAACNAMTKKLEGDSHFLAVAVVLILVVVLGGLFKTQLTTLFTSIFTNTTTQVNNLF